MGWFIVAFLAIIFAGAIVRGFKQLAVNYGEVGLMYRAGKFAKELEPGIRWIFDPLGRTMLHRIPVLPSALNPHLYEVISKDQFAFRVTLTPLYTIINAREFHENTPLSDIALHGYQLGPEARFTRLSPIMAEGVIKAVSEVTLEQFMADPVAALAPVAGPLADALPGAQLDRLAITAVTLPPEIRKMFTEVERARREGLASLERAKSEQASLRALANAARNMAGNPQLAQLKMLQVMENAKGAKTFVLGDQGTASGVSTKD